MATLRMRELSLTAAVVAGPAGSLANARRKTAPSPPTLRCKAAVAVSARPDEEELPARDERSAEMVDVVVKCRAVEAAHTGASAAELETECALSSADAALLRRTTSAPARHIRRTKTEVGKQELWVSHSFFAGRNGCGRTKCGAVREMNAYQWSANDRSSRAFACCQYEGKTCDDKKDTYRSVLIFFCALSDINRC